VLPELKQTGPNNNNNNKKKNSHSVLVAEMCAGWKKSSVLVQFVSPYDEHCVLETCREL
jgi:hypothetical protein